MTQPSFDERLASRVSRVLAVASPVMQRLFSEPTRIDGQELDPGFFIMTRATRIEPSTDLRRFRAMQNKLARIGGGPGLPGVISRDLEVNGAAGRIRARLYEAAREHGGAEPGGPLLVYYHGGGFVFGDLDTHHSTCTYFAVHAGVKVLAIDYRLAPEHPYPAAPDDARAALAWAHAHAAELGVDPARIGVAGDSAGGNLAAVTARTAARDGGPAPSCQILIYPGMSAGATFPSRELFGEGFFLTQASIRWFGEQYTPVRSDEPDPRRNPLDATDLEGLPPAYVITAGFDPLRDEGEAYAAMLEKAGNQVIVRRFRSLLHGFVNLVGSSPVCRAATIEVAGAARVLLHRRA